ncbi:hypothetical protein NP233_g5624 [Leucocoprinus birnbaumii]|uniref:Nucleoside transporter n=1 Tax=Leucocoprinus birnbaumii TaxID=56174 RepID=A0AAD5YQR8_9AGAR|nr:hypothetical protein NP233_g5624 [Leucocoprinus birnbaumii]
MQRPLLGSQSPHARYLSVAQNVSPDHNQVEQGVGKRLSRTKPLTESGIDAKVQWIFFILGCSLLLPWNVLIAAIPYFTERLAGSSIQLSFSSYLLTACTVSNFGFLAHATITSKRTSPSERARLSIYCLVFLNVLLIFSTRFTCPPRIFAALILLIGAVQNAASSYLQTAMIAVASLYGPAAIRAMMAGPAATAVAISVVQVLSAAASIGAPEETHTMNGDDTPGERSAFIFLTVSTLFLIASAGAHAWLVSMPSYQAVVAHLELGDAKPRRSVSEAALSQLRLSREGTQAAYDEIDDNKQVIRISKANLTYEITVAYVFIVTFVCDSFLFTRNRYIDMCAWPQAVFPSVTGAVVSVNPGTHYLIFTAIHLLVFNTSDFVGRYICSIPFFQIWSPKILLGMAFARTLFIPLCLMCNVGQPTISLLSVPLVNSDLLFMFIMALLGWSNGYVSTLCIISAPSLEHNPRLEGRIEDVDVAATLINFFLAGGLVLGSVANFAVMSAIH